MTKNMKDLKQRLMPKFEELHKKGYRGMYVTKTYMVGLFIEPDLSQFPRSKVTIKKIKHNVDLKKYGVKLKNNEVIRMGWSHFYIDKVN